MQKTLRGPVRFTGCGLHSGASVNLTVEPAGVDHGLRFVRRDLEGAPEGQVGPHAATESSRCMRLSWNDTFSVLTPEHVLSACAGLGITNAKLVLEGPEVPILDGSALPFADAFVAEGIKSQSAVARVLHLSAPLAVHDGNALVLLRPQPAETLSITYVAAYPHALVGTQVYEFTPHIDYLSQVAPARTFGFIEEVEALRAQGLIAGGSLDCAVVVMPDHYSSPLRFPDELARHKTLDLIGDLAVLGMGLAAHVVAVRSSHRLHTRLLHLLMGLSEYAEACATPSGVHA